MPNFWKFKNEAGSETAELMLYGEVSDKSWYGDEITPKAFHDDLTACEGKPLDVHINSPGGDVFAAQAIYNQLKAYTGKVTMYIDGMCASAATIIACAGDTVIMPSNTIYMIHNPQSAMLGYYAAPQLDKISASLSAVKQTIVNVYMARVQGALSEIQLKNKMDSETWMTADQAKSYGFIDEISDAIPIEQQWDNDALIVNSVACRLERFNNLSDLRAVLPTDKKKRSDLSMTDNEILQKIKNVLGIGGQAAETPPTPKPENDTRSKETILNEERQRVAALDDMKNGNPAVDAIIETAKSSGATADSVKPYVDAVSKEQPADLTISEEKMLVAIKAILQDNADSGASGVKSAPQSGQKNEAAEKAANIEEVANCANRLMGVK